MIVPASWKGVLNRYSAAPVEIQEYFEHFPKLAKGFPWDVCLSYLFSRIEMAQHSTIYCGIVKLHWGESSLTWEAIQKQHMTRPDFQKFFVTVFGKEIDSKIRHKLKDAEEIRDKALHGKSVSDAEYRKAVVCLIEYAEEFNDFVNHSGGFKPFGNLRGFKGRGESLEKATTRWMLKGMGFALS